MSWLGWGGCQGCCPCVQLGRTSRCQDCNETGHRRYCASYKEALKEANDDSYNSIFGWN